MKKILFLLFTGVSSALSAQSSLADSYFDNYEYAKAAELYEKDAQKKKLSIDEYKKLGYSYYIIGALQKCLPISDSLTKINSIEPFFVYMNGDVNLGLGNYSKAKTSYQHYQTLDDEFNVTLKIEACDLMPTWLPVEHEKLINASFNNSKSNISGQQNGQIQLYFSEIGIDSAGSNYTGDLFNASLVLSRPHYLNENNELILMNMINDNDKFSSSSMAIKGSDAIFSLSFPLATNPLEFSPHLYHGEYDANANSISNIELWEYSGYEDSSACSHPSFNESGSMIVFTKTKKGSQSSNLFVSYKEGDKWSKPTLIESISTESDEMFPMFAGDSLLYFSSNGRLGYGGLDIYYSKIDNGAFSEPVHLKAPINSFNDDFNYVVLTKDSSAFTSNRYGGKGDDDIYVITFEKEEIIVEIPDSSEFFEFVDNWKDKNIYFDFDKYNLKEEITGLEGLKKFLSEYPDSKLIVEGHADPRGTDAYNNKLSEKRVETVKSVLTDLGIIGEQVQYAFKGESDLQSECKKCSEEDYSLDRVVIIKLIAK